MAGYISQSTAEGLLNVLWYNAGIKIKWPGSLSGSLAVSLSVPKISSKMWFISVDRQIIFTGWWGITRSHVAYFLWPTTSHQSVRPWQCCVLPSSLLTSQLLPGTHYWGAVDRVPMVSRLVTRSLLQQIIFIIIMLRLIITTHFLYFPSPFYVMINKIVFTIISRWQQSYH